MNELKERLENLTITVSADGDGVFTAVTFQEPYFCFVRDSVEELQELVADTLKSYITTFYDVEEVRVETVEISRSERLPVQTFKPIKSLAPRFPANGFEMACA